MTERTDYIELPAGDLAATKCFYASGFGSGVTYSDRPTPGSSTLGLDGGLAAGDAATTTIPLVLIRADDLDDALALVEGAGGEITAPIFEFRGGRRFHFR